MALVGWGWLIRAVGLATHQAGYCARPRIHKHARTGYDLRVLRRRQRHLDHVDAKQRGVRILVRCSTRTSGQLFVLTDERSSRHVDINVVLVIRIDDQCVRVRAATGLHRGHLLWTLDVTDIENSHAAETIFLRGWWLILILSRSWRRIRRKSLSAAIDSAVRHFDRHEHQVLINRNVALSAGADHR